MSRWWWGVVSALVALSASHALGQADDESPAVQESRRRFEIALEAFDRGEFAVALTEFDRVYALLDGHPRRAYVLYNLARTNEELGRYREALAQYDRYLAEAGDDAPSRGDAQRHARELRLRLELDARAEGATGSPAVGGGFSPSPVGIAIASVGAAAMLAGGVIGGVALAQDSEARGRCNDGVCPADAHAALVDAHLLANAADGLLWVGLGVAAVGLVLTFALGESASPAAAGAACTSEGCGAFVRWSL